ncbi:hypothetical protein CsSME_00042728 [Camellia sinensis var. sinensis]
MAKIEDNTIISKPRSRTSSCFLGCFGFSGKVKVSEEIPRKKSPRWFSWPRLKKSDAKTVPVDAAAAPAGKKITSKHHAPAKIPADSPEQSEHEKLQKTRHETSQNIILEDNKDLDHVSSTKKNTCQKQLSIDRKITVSKISNSHPSSPKKKSKVDHTITVLSPSSSPKQKKKQVTNVGENSKSHGNKMLPESDTLIGKFDPVIGLSIIMVTLIIMFVWGRVCAILCTAALFYVVRRFKIVVRSSVSTQNESNQIDSDLNYDEYKKKVVLEGFLERKHRNIIGNL